MKFERIFKSLIRLVSRGQITLFMGPAIAIVAATNGSAWGQFAPKLAGPIEDVWTTERPVSWLEGPSFGAGDIWFGDPGNIFIQPPELPEPTRLMRFDPETGTTTTAIDFDSDPNIFGTEFDSQGRLISTHLGKGTVTRRNVDQPNSVEVLANGFAGEMTFIPNDLVIDTNDGIYFTSFMQNAPAELGDSAVFYVDPAGELSMAGDLAGNRDANGIGISPDGSTMYVAFAFQGEVRAYDITSHGVLQNERFFAASPGGVDGITVDRHGNVYVGDLGLSDPPMPQPDLPGSMVRIFNPTGEELLAFEPPHGAVNMTMAADDSLYIAGWNVLSRVPIEFEQQTHKVISPSAYADVEGEGADTTVEFRSRSQQVFPAEDFAHLEAGTYAITQFAWRPDGVLEAPEEAIYGNITVEMALTDAGYDELSVVFEDNYLTHPRTVREGETLITTEDAISDNGVTKEFDQAISLDRPFLYDPSDGNLLLELRAHQGANVATLADFIGDAPQAMVTSRGDSNREVADISFGGFVVEFTMQRIEPGDFDASGALDVTDLELLAVEVSRSPGDPAFDLNDDGIVNTSDYTLWATTLKNTWIGDANLDGEFNSGDLTLVFQSAKYELDEHAGWDEGDWNGDARFNSSDLVAAFQDDGYEMGPRAALVAVPEPSSWILLTIGVLCLCRCRRR